MSDSTETPAEVARLRLQHALNLQTAAKAAMALIASAVEANLPSDETPLGVLVRMRHEQMVAMDRRDADPSPSLSLDMLNAATTTAINSLNRNVRHFNSYISGFTRPNAQKIARLAGMASIFGTAFDMAGEVEKALRRVRIKAPQDFATTVVEAIKANDPQLRIAPRTQTTAENVNSAETLALHEEYNRDFQRGAEVAYEALTSSLVFLWDEVGFVQRCLQWMRPWLSSLVPNLHLDPLTPRMQKLLTEARSYSATRLEPALAPDTREPFFQTVQRSRTNRANPFYVLLDHCRTIIRTQDVVRGRALEFDAADTFRRLTDEQWQLVIENATGNSEVRVLLDAFEQPPNAEDATQTSGRLNFSIYVEQVANDVRTIQMLTGQLERAQGVAPSTDPAPANGRSAPASGSADAALA